jgi:putative endonuclease
VCRDRSENALVFVEVKTRKDETHGAPGEFVDLDKQKLIARGAMVWLRMLDNPDVIYRFDIVEVVVSAEKTEVRVIKNAFPLPEPYF